ncbi:MAG: 23S rRNA (adenine(2503)-C(2))-methyltransferase RlmN [Proteobacteria bacterium]|nr:23S rRNA (adenine(2503)-C(2))-methyltransferase RlmN [Pseudomonadota bacterium]
MEFKDLTMKELTTIVAGFGKPAYSAKNIFKWIYKRRVEDFNQMTDIANELRSYFSQNYKISGLKIIETEKAKDGCIKFLFELKDGQTIESVLIPKEDRITVCVSTQVGCKMGCTFCCTAKQGFTRDLSTSEIVNQVMDINYYAKEQLGFKTDDSGFRTITNIVFMGMGEPLDNIEAVIKAVDILTDHNALAFGTRKITVSTCGLIPQMFEFKKRSGVKLAISLNAANDELRDKIMPINKTYKINELISSIKKLPLKSLEFITIEYILFRGLNDSKKDAETLAKLLKDLPVKVNLIPFNPHPGAPDFDAPDVKTLSDFYDYLASKGVICNVRHSRGTDISAACGQLKSRAKR